MQMISTTESRPVNYLFSPKSRTGGAEGWGGAHIFLHFNINAFHVYIFPVTSVWITLQRDDISRQGKPATLSRQSINQRKIIRNISQATAPGCICTKRGWRMENGARSMEHGGWRRRLENADANSNAELALEKWATSAFWQPNKYETSDDRQSFISLDIRLKLKKWIKIFMCRAFSGPICLPPCPLCFLFSFVFQNSLRIR